jgi:hypothetical protein
LVYHLSPLTNIRLTYARYVNSGSGFFAGANSDTVSFGLNHSLNRRWSLLTHSGYSRSTRLLSATTAVAGNAPSYHYWFTGGAVRRQLGRDFGAFISYQYDAFGFASGYCRTGSGCNNNYGRHIALIGLDWTPHPIRLD